MDKAVPKKIKPNYDRIVTAMLIVAAVLGAIAVGNKGIAILFLLINLLGARELCFVLEPKKTSVSNVLYMLLALLPFILLYFIGLDFGSYYMNLLLISVGYMIGLIYNLWFDKMNFTKVRYFFTIFYWGLPWSLASYFLLFGGIDLQIVTLGIILLIWTSDTMAYFTGKAIGKNKLFPSVSPGKTIEGSLGAGVFSIIVGCLFAFILQESFSKWIVLAIIIWILGTLGDLVESKLKRSQNVKDSGSVLKGHGGFLDRFDSLVLLIPFLLLLEYYFRS